MDQVKSAIKELRCKNAYRHWFVPELAFYSVITEDAIRGALAESLIHPSQREEVVQKVSQRGKKIFGILVLIDHAAQLSKFIEADQLEDAKLPFKVETLSHDIQLSKEEAKDFDEKQWELIAPTFHRGTLNRRLEEDAVLPFTQDRRIGRGAFGTVYEAVLDSRHQELNHKFPEKVLSGCSCRNLLVTDILPSLLGKSSI